MYVQANLTLADSEVTLDEQGRATNTKRNLQGQADHVFNLQLGYQGAKHDATVSFNRVGERLQGTGEAGQPDIFQEPVNSLDAKYTYTWTDDLKLSFSVRNLLDEDIESLQAGAFPLRDPGRRRKHIAELPLLR
ncbi:MAG: hypothetical protein U5K73_03490 [Halofilum sp. (in: g-proteobacteria)]|nr:hypothetical protein [Halofilum sp. (in: g-proteobacteria)]